MPELAFVFFIGICITLIANLIHLWKIQKHFQSQKYLQIQTNLQKIQSYWSSANTEIQASIHADQLKNDIQQDQSKTRNSALILLALTTFMSWFGLILFLIYTISIYKIARPRTEQKLFSSQIASFELSPQQIQHILGDCHPN